jgi:adenylosuccinate synthase
VAAVTAPNAELVIAQGSEIDPPVLEREVAELNSAGYEVTRRLSVDQWATVIEPVHARAEQAAGFVENFGSTAKGIGMARMDRLRRTAKTWEELHRFSGPLGMVDDTALDLQLELSPLHGPGADIVIEGTQGYGLGLHGGYYPFCTSGDCRAVDFLAQAGISPWAVSNENLRVVVCFRPYPIRVAGNSGPLKDETSWEALGLAPEHTTVTRKVRRVGAWNSALARAAMRANGAPSGSVYAALVMADQISPELAGRSGDVQDGWSVPLPIVGMYHDLLEADLAYIGTGPDTALVDPKLYA